VARRARLATLVAVASALAAGGRARADGAFPNSQNVMTPASLPHAILLGTNFGLVMSADDGQTWTWSCEQPLNAFATLYQVGAAPAHRLYAVSPLGAISSDDIGCSWSAASDVPAGTALDVFADPGDANRAFAVVTESTDAGVLYHVKLSTNGGRTFDTVLYTAAAGDHVTGVEAARSAPQTIYLTLTSGTYTPKVAQTTDGGAHWTVHDLTASLAAKTYSISLIAVDAANAQKLFLRVGSAAGEALAVSTDGGATASSPLPLAGGSLTAFTRLESGSLFAAGVAGTENVVYRSTDGGASFQKLPPAPPVRGLSARGTTLYAATDTMSDSAAIETSSDEGMTWKPLMAYSDIQAIQSCVMSTCQDDCLNRADMQQWADTICSATAPAGGVDAAAGTTGGGSGGPTGGSNGGSAGGSPGGASGAGESSGGGCHCAAAGTGASSWPALALLGLAWAGRRRSRRPR